MRRLILLLFFLTFICYGQNTESKRKELGLLAFSGQEIININSFLDGNLIIDESINKNDFLKNIENYDIIHLATHTIIDQSNPLNSRFYISNNSKLNEEKRAVYASDILSLNLKAKMAVLSSCNTGYGDLISGEGIMSLARTFKYAGCPSIIMSLWEIDDVSTSEIMNHFYEGLNSKLSKDESIRNAKLAYLKSSTSKNSAPIFWAGIVPIGDMQSLEFSHSEFKPYYYLIILSLLFIIVFIIYSYKKRRIKLN